MTTSFRAASYEFVEDLVHVTGHFGGLSWLVNAVVTERGALQRRIFVHARNGREEWREFVDLSTGTLRAIERHFEGKAVVLGGTAGGPAWSGRCGSLKAL
jgi:hypothetical protein